ncbi:MAG TPA: hypothetical protein VFL13_14790 [Candidatus Baltobacteraceae bacterium]|nr:hypothetical protein [Candidatus Baltobacteraceae bacterium]
MRLAVFVAFALVLTGARASALPVFAHRYGFTCEQCHTTVPNLNAFGRYFLRSGFRLPGGARGVVPMAVKVQTAYASAAPNGPRLPKAIVDEVEILSAGSLGRNTSYFLEQYAVDGGVPGRPRDMWADMRRTFGIDQTGPSLHARMGSFTLPLPLDPETQRPTLAHYAVFDQTVGNNSFTLFDPRTGLDAYYTDDRRGVEAHLILAQGVDRGSGFPAAGIDTMGSFSKTIGSDLTAYVYRYRGQRALGRLRDRFARDGYALSYGHQKLEVTSLVQQGFDTSADGEGAGALSSGGFLQAGWHFSDSLALYARYDRTNDPFNLRQTAATLSLVTRPQRNMRFTLEGSRGADRSYQVAGGLLFAY